MNPLGERRPIHYATRLGIAYNDGGVVVDPHVHADSIVSRKLHNRIIGYHGENKNGPTVLNLDDRQGYFPLSEPLVVEVEDQPIPRALNNHLQDNFTVRKRVILNTGISAVHRTQVYIVLTIRRSGPVCGTFPALAHVLRAFPVSGFNTLLVGTVRRDNVVLD